MVNHMNLLEKNSIVSKLRSTALGTLVIAVSATLSQPILAFGQEKQPAKPKKQSAYKSKIAAKKVTTLARHNISSRKALHISNSTIKKLRSNPYASSKNKKTAKTSTHLYSPFAWQAVQPNHSQTHYTYSANDLTEQTALQAAVANTPKPTTPPAKPLQIGTASYYSDKFNGGRTASGERLDQRKLTCAHGSLPFGCRIRVTNLNNNRSVEVKVNDRGSFGNHGRVLDLTKAAAGQIGMIGTGTAKVKVERID